MNYNQISAFVMTKGFFNSGFQPERKDSRFRRYVLGSIIFLTLALAATHTFLHRTSVGSQRFVRMTFLVYAGTFLAVLALLILATILGRNLIKLYFEKKSGRPGSGFKTKLVRTFIALSLLPALLLFVFAYALINSSIEKWFLAPPAQIQESSRALVRQYYDDTEKRAKYYAGIIAGQLEPPEDFPVSDLQEKLREYCTTYAINTVRIFDMDGRLAAESGPTISSPHHQDFLTVMIAEALKGNRQFRFDSVAPRDPGDEICYASAPLIDVGGRIAGAVLTETMRSSSLKFWADRVTDAADKYDQLRIERNFLRLNMLMMLALATLLVIFAFAWFALYLSKRITVPVQALVEGAAAVSEGNLAHRVNCPAFDELGSLVTSFNMMTADLEENEKRIYQMEKAAAWQEVAQRLAHEIKNPLTPIRLSAERVLNRYKKIAEPVSANLPAPQLKEFARFDQLLTDCVQTIVQETDSLKNLVDEFSRFARLPEARPKTTDIRTIIENALQLYDGSISGIQIVKEFDADLPRLRLDPEQMKRAFINIFDNAIKAMSQNKGRRTLRIIAFTDWIQGTARIEISDNGRGFYEENHDNLFLPYFSTREGGTGLGLAIVRQIITDHHGGIYAEANVPAGTRIVIDLPLIHKAVEPQTDDYERQ